MLRYSPDSATVIDELARAGCRFCVFRVRCLALQTQIALRGQLLDPQVGIRRAPLSRAAARRGRTSAARRPPAALPATVARGRVVVAPRGAGAPRQTPRPPAPRRRPSSTADRRRSHTARRSRSARSRAARSARASRGARGVRGHRRTLASGGFAPAAGRGRRHGAARRVGRGFVGVRRRCRRSRSATRCRPVLRPILAGRDDVVERPGRLELLHELVDVLGAPPEDAIVTRVAPSFTDGRTDDSITSGGSVASIWLKSSVQENVRWSISALASCAAATTSVELVLVDVRRGSSRPPPSAARLPLRRRRCGTTARCSAATATRSGWR